MNKTRAKVQPALSLSPHAGWLRSAWARSVATLLRDDATRSVDVLDAGVRSLAFATVLVLSLLGYGKSGGSYPDLAVDPVLVAAGLAAYNLLVIAIVGVPWRKRPGFGLFLLDWVVVSAAVLVTGGFFSQFLILYYALIIGAALRVGLSRSLLLVAGCAIVYAALSAGNPTPVDAIHLPVLVVGVTSLLMVAVTAVTMRRAVEVEVRKVEYEEQTAGQLRLLNNLTRVVLSGSPDLAGVMRTVAAVSSSALQADRGLAMLFDAGNPPEDNHHSPAYSPGYLIVADGDPNPQRLSPAEQRVADQAVRTQAPVLVACAEDHAHGETGMDFPGLQRDGLPVRAVACAPFLLSGGVIGVLFVGRYEPQPFNEAEVNLLTAIGQQMAVAVRLARLYEHERARASRSEEREQLERDLLSIVSHELRTPLTSIKTCVGALESIESVEAGETAGATTEARLLRNIERSTDRLIVLVNELLDMARLRAGRVSLNRQQLNMGEVAQEMAAQVCPLLDTCGQTLTLDLPAPGSPRWEMLAVLADRRRIEQVLLNLLSNANKYSPTGGRITLGATPREGQVRVFVRDDGSGIAPEDQAHIFEKFYRATPPSSGGKVGAESRPDGSGLGLAIARSIVELHGGQIGVQSRPGRGSTFYFTLPCEW